MSRGRAVNNRSRDESCAYCTRSGLKMEAEHVFPESWYPDGFPRASMVLVPACRKCNGDYGRIEERMFLPLVGGLPYDDPAIRSIIDRALRGADPNAANDARDVSYRGARRRSIQRRFELIGPNEHPQTVVWTPAARTLSNVRTPAGLVARGTPAVRFDPEDLSALGVKFLKGCYFVAKGVPLRADGVCESQAFSQNPTEALRSAEQHLHLNFVGQLPFRYAFARATEDDAVTAWWFILWNHVVIFASSCSPEYLDYVSNDEGD
jgi:hypothetical protein